MATYYDIASPYYDYQRLVVAPDERERRPIGAFVLFLCCILVCPAIWIAVACAVDGSCLSHSNGIEGACCCYGCSDDDDVCFAGTYTEQQCRHKCDVDDEAPSKKRTNNRNCESFTFFANGTCPTSCQPTVPPTPPPPPPGACCCSGCSLNRCVENVATQGECTQLCDEGQPPPLLLNGEESQTCASQWSPGMTCGQSACPQPVDCCPQDPFVIEGSPYGSSQTTLCGTHDYDCDGVDEHFPCCHRDDPVAHDFDSRTIYNVRDDCPASQGEPLSADPEQVCGACTGSEIVPGWECSEGLGHHHHSAKKRFVPPCPEQCEPDEPQEVTPETPPSLGECALFVDHCIGQAGGDGEQCCIVVSQ